MSKSEIEALRAMLAATPTPTTIDEMRRGSERTAQLNPPPADVTIEPITISGVPAEWTSTPNAVPDRVILFFHGGGYAFGSVASRRHVVGEIGRAAEARVLSVDYRLAPEHPFPSAVEDGIASYRYLLEAGIEPSNIAIAGDSAGGGLAIATLLSARSAGLPQPSCCWVISPWVDMTSSGESMTSKASEDPMVQKALIEFLSANYLNGADPRNPLASPIYADLAGLPPLLIQVGSTEVLLDDSIRLAGRAGAANVPVTLEIWPDMIHIWPVFHRRLAAGRKAISTGGAFMRLSMNDMNEKS